jgi:chromosome segregation ATPase
MATAMIYDTLKLAEQLEHEAGFDTARARAMARILAENTGGNLASREDIRELATKSELMATKSELMATKSELLAAREDIRELATKSELMATKSELLAAREDIRELAAKSELMATKSELLAAREDIRELAAKSELMATKSELLAAKGELRAEIQDLRGDIRVLYWITGTTLAGVTGLMGIAITIALHFMHLG